MRGWYARESRKSALEYGGGDYANLLFLPLWGMRLASSALGEKPQRSLRELDSGAAAGSEARGPPAGVPVLGSFRLRSQGERGVRRGRTCWVQAGRLYAPTASEKLRARGLAVRGGLLVYRVYSQ